MAFTYRSKRLGYDNISVGNAAGREKIIVTGDTTPGETTKLTLSQRGTSTSALSQGMPERLIRLPSSDDSNVEETRLTSNTSHTGQTSGTSDTSVQYENL